MTKERLIIIMYILFFRTKYMYNEEYNNSQSLTINIYSLCGIIYFVVQGAMIVIDLNIQLVQILKKI